MLVIWLYRSIRGRWRKRQQRRAGNVVAVQQQAAPQDVATPAATVRDNASAGEETSNKKMSSSTKLNLMLMAALAIPVFLETLDYTGKVRLLIIQ